MLRVDLLHSPASSPVSGAAFSPAHPLSARTATVAAAAAARMLLFMGVLAVWVCAVDGGSGAGRGGGCPPCPLGLDRLGEVVLGVVVLDPEQREQLGAQDRELGVAAVAGALLAHLEHA